MSFANVAYVNANVGGNTINITSLTNSYNIINNGIYTNPTVPLRDIIRVGDTVLIANNPIQTVTNVDYNNSILYVGSVLSNTVSNSLLSATRTLTANAQSVLIYEPVGQQ